MTNKRDYSIRSSLIMLCIVSSYMLMSCATTPLVTDLVTIHYRVICNVGTIFPNANNSNEYFTPQNALFVIYQITAIDNNDTQPNQFNFSLNKVRVANYLNDQAGNVFPALNSHFNASQNAVVAAGSTGAPIGDFIIEVHTGSFPSTAQDQHAWYQLTYAADPGEHVLFVRDAALRPNFPSAFQQVSQNEVYWFDQMPSWLFDGFLGCNRGYGAPSVGCSPQ